MRIAAVTAEFNPMHVGHLRLLADIRESLSPDILVVLLGGDITQRGELAVLDKYTRAKHAILAGADIVLELPQIFACSCAERFADAAVKLLSSFEAEEKYICFGSECGELAPIENAARILTEEPEEMRAEMRAMLDMGCSYPIARSQAFSHYAEIHNIPVANLTLPNNILATEYVRSAIKRGVSAYTIKRNGAYHTEELDPTAPSASAVRQAFWGGKDIPAAILPPFVKEDLMRASRKDLLSPLVLYRLRMMSTEGLKRIADVSEGIENRIMKALGESANLKELIKNVSTKRYTEARVGRILTNALLGVTQQLFQYAQEEAPYSKVLAVKRSRTDILSFFGKTTKVLTGENEAAECGIKCAETDAKAHEIYAIAKETPDLDSGMLLI